MFWEMFLYALWVAVWPSFRHRLTHLFVQDFIPSRVEVEAYEEGEECQRYYSYSFYLRGDGMKGKAKQLYIPS